MTRIFRSILPRSICCVGALFLAVAATGGLPAAEAQQWRPPSQRSTAPSINQPPAPRSEARPPARRGYVWVPGHWEWSARDGRVWVPGRYVRDRPGYRYVGPEWTFRNGQWVFVPGRWVRR